MLEWNWYHLLDGYLQLFMETCIELKNIFSLKCVIYNQVKNVMSVSSLNKLINYHISLFKSSPTIFIIDNTLLLLIL